jgi:hypothetical protein
MSVSELVIEAGEVDGKRLLADWEWLLEDSYTSLALVSTFGDLFLQAPDGTIHWLDSLCSSSVKPVAEDLGAFRHKLEAPTDSGEWLMPGLVERLRTEGKVLAREQCYGCKIPPFLGGSFQPSNFYPANIYGHCSFMADVARQTKDLPNGTKVRLEIL